MGSSVTFNSLNYSKFLVDHSDAERLVITDVGYQVRFRSSLHVSRTVSIKKLNPRRAVVECDISIWDVPYITLNHECNATSTERYQRLEWLVEVAK